MEDTVSRPYRDELLAHAMVVQSVVYSKAGVHRHWMNRFAQLYMANCALLYMGSMTACQFYAGHSVA